MYLETGLVYLHGMGRDTENADKEVYASKFHPVQLNSTHSMIISVSIFLY